MKGEDVVFSLIRKGCEEEGSVFERRIFKMALLLNIHPDKYRKIKDKLVEKGKVVADRHSFSLP